MATHGVTGRVVIAELVDLDRLTAWRVLAGSATATGPRSSRADRVAAASTWNASA